MSWVGRIVAVVIACALSVLGATAVGTAQAAPVKVSVQAAASTAPARFVPLQPARILDTRNGTGGTTGPVKAASTINLSVLGHGGVPGTGVSAVVVNLTAVSPSGAGYLLAYPAGGTKPTASNLNYVKGADIANQAVVAVGSNGAISLFSQSATQLIVDVTGYYPAGGSYRPVTPTRLVDTRSGAKPAAGSTITVPVAGKAGIPPAGAAAAILNITATGATGGGYLTAYPTGEARPNASTLNYVKGQTVASMTIAKLGSGGAVSVYAYASTHVIVDVVGYILTGSDYTPVSPTRLMDTRSGGGGTSGPVAGGATVTLQVAGAGGIPRARVTAAELTVTVVSPASAGSLRVFPAWTGLPSTSVVNFLAGQTIANSTTIKVPASGQVSLYASTSAQFVVDVTGYFSATSTATQQWGNATSVDPYAGNLTSVSCPTAAFCAAVDTNGWYLTRINGVWSAPKVIAQGAPLTAVSCTSASFCAAVTSDGRAATWNGSGWSAVATIDAGTAGITSVSCAVANFCVAVDQEGNALTWSGSGWTLKNIDSHGGLMSVSCPTTSFCMAVDYTGYTVRMAGTTWQTPVFVDADGAIYSVSCPDSSFCMAVDYGGGAMTWNSGTWSAVAPISPANRQLDSVSCASKTDCMVVAFDGTALAWHAGTWGTLTTADSTGGLTAVSCTAANACVAVGQNGQQLTWNGSTWSTPRTIDTASGGPTGVSCSDAGTCTLVDTMGSARRLTAGSWSAATVVSPMVAQAAVSCVPGDWCMSVDRNGVTRQSTAGVWSPADAPIDGGVSGLSCVSRSFCLVVSTSGAAYTWNGSSWTPAAGAAVKTSGVSCTAAGTCTAVTSTGAVQSFRNGACSTLWTVNPAWAWKGVSCAANGWCLAYSGDGRAAVFSSSSSTISTVTTGAGLTAASCQVGTGTTPITCVAGDAKGSAYVFDGDAWTAPMTLTASSPITGISCVGSTCQAVSADGRAVTGSAP